jgi:hypothetical protein
MWTKQGIYETYFSFHNRLANDATIIMASSEDAKICIILG